MRTTNAKDSIIDIVTVCPVFNAPRLVILFVFGVHAIEENVPNIVADQIRLLFWQIDINPTAISV